MIYFVDETGILKINKERLNFLQNINMPSISIHNFFSNKKEAYAIYICILQNEKEKFVNKINELNNKIHEAIAEMDKQD